MDENEREENEYTGEELPEEEVDTYNEEEYDEEDYDGEGYDEEEYGAELDIDETTEEEGHLKYSKVNHFDRAAINRRLSDGNVTEYMNIALEYFGYRCALSGESFAIFNKKVSNNYNSNLSAEHVVALTNGGDDIVPNLVPSVLQYNVQKNGYYLMDYWEKAKDMDGKPIYSPERLLKLTNYMLKSLEAREYQKQNDIEAYRKALLTPNAIDEYLAQIEKEDEREVDNTKRKLVSNPNTPTTTKEDVDGKKILRSIPSVEGDIPDLKIEEKNFDQDHELVMMNIFLTDAIKKLGEYEEFQGLVPQLKEMYQNVSQTVPFEVMVRDYLLTVVQGLGIEQNQYSIANAWLNDKEITDKIKELYQAERPQEEIQNEVSILLKKQIEEIPIDTSFEKKVSIVASNPRIVFNEEARKEFVNTIILYQKYIDEEINYELLKKTYLQNSLKIKEWMKDNKTTKPPRCTIRDKDGNKALEEEAKLGIALNSIRQNLIKPYLDIKDEEGRRVFEEEHPEVIEVLEIVKWIDENNVHPYLQNARDIKQWMKDNKTTKPPRQQNKDKTIPEEEATLGTALNSIRHNLIKPYLDIKDENERKDFEQKHPEITEVLEIVNWIDENNVHPYLQNARDIKQWMKDNKITKPPRCTIRDKDGNKALEKEATLGTALRDIRQKLIKPYDAIKDDREREAFEQEHPEVIEVLEIVKWIDENNSKKNKNVSGQSLGEASYSAPTEKCDEAGTQVAEALESRQKKKGKSQEEVSQ